MSKATAAARADIATVAAIKATSPQSQLAHQPINKQPAPITGDTARFVLADVQGKEAAASYRLSVIRTAIIEMMKGNPRNLKEAIATSATLGTSAKATGYAAGFAALADVKALERKSPRWMDDANADVRTEAETLADAFTVRFDSAYTTAITDKASKAAATRAANKAAKEAAAAALAAVPAEAAAPAPAPADVQADTVVEEVAVGDMVAAVVQAVKQGMLTEDELDTLRATLAAMDVPGALLAAPAEQAALTH